MSITDSRASVTETVDFKYSVQCLDCAYEDIGWNGSMKCRPRTKGCIPMFPYDMAIGSRIRKADLRFPSGSKEDVDGTKRGVAQKNSLKISREG